jgi:Calx-beta domain
MTFTISLDAAAAVPVQVDYATSDNTATAGADYTAKSGTAVIPAGSTSTTVDVALLDDAVYEGDETLNLDLSAAVNGSISDAQGQGTITDDDAAPTISVDSPSVGEGGGTLTFTISIDAAAAVDTSVDYATSDGSATDGQDYTGQNGTATITAGSTSTTVDVPVLDDSIYEGDETVHLDLSNPVNGQGSPNTTGTITDDDALPTISVDDPAVNEGDGTATFTVSIDSAAGVDTSVDYATSDGSATDGQDYTGQNGTATILAGSTSTTVDVPLLDDTVHESDETFSLDLSNPVNGQGSPSGTATISDDDGAPDVSISDANVVEGNSGTADLMFDVTLSNASSSDVSVDYATSDSTATVGSDYTAASGTLTIPAGDTSGTITVHAKGDTTYEADETLTVTLSGLVGGGSITNDTAIGMIRNDDKQPSTVSAKVTKTHKNVGARGLLEPASTGNTVTVVLAKSRHHTWHVVKTKVVTVKKLADRDTDGLIDAKYGARFPCPKHGRYRVTISFAGDGNTAATGKVVRFKL